MLKGHLGTPANNTLGTGWLPCGDIHCHWVVLAENSYAVCFCRRQILGGVFHLLAKVVNMANFCCFYTNQCYLVTSFPKYFRLHATATSLGLLEPLFLQKFHFIGIIFWDNKNS